MSGDERRGPHPARRGAVRQEAADNTGAAARRGPARFHPLRPGSAGARLASARLRTVRPGGARRGSMLALFNKLLDWFRALFWKEEMELTLVGLQYSGKTTFVNVIAVSTGPHPVPAALTAPAQPRPGPGALSAGAPAAARPSGCHGTAAPSRPGPAPFAAALPAAAAVRPCEARLSRASRP